MPSGSRQLSDWVEGFVAHTDKLGSPRLFQRWAAIAAIAGALERKVCVETARGAVWPNMYTVLVGPPGTGKTIVSSLVEDLWRGIGTHHVAPKSLTKSAIIDSLNDAKRTTPAPNYSEFHSLLIHAGELGVLLPAYESDFMNVLTDIWDGRIYEERRRTKDLHIKITKPQLNILACTTPDYLNNVLPEGAWNQGFLSRTMIAFSGAGTLTDLFSDEVTDYDEFSILKSDLRAIGNLQGKFQWEAPAKAALAAWHLAKGPPQPDHPKLVNYLTRRSMHLIKLCMVASVSAGSHLTISLDHYNRALSWLLDLESSIPEVFLAMSSGGDQEVMNEAWYFLYDKFKANNKAIGEDRLVAFLSARVPSYKVIQVMELMLKQRMISDGMDSVTGRKTYKPLTIERY